jgi:hypothetical protein
MHYVSDRGYMQRGPRLHMYVILFCALPAKACFIFSFLLLSSFHNCRFLWFYQVENIKISMAEGVGDFAAGRYEIRLREIRLE